MLGSCLLSEGIVLDFSGFVLISCPFRGGFALGLCWVRARFMPSSCWLLAGSVLGPCWVRAGFMLGPCWVRAGFLLVSCWCALGSSLVRAGFGLGLGSIFSTPPYPLSLLSTFFGYFSHISVIFVFFPAAAESKVFTKLEKNSTRGAFDTFVVIRASPKRYSPENLSYEH